MPNIERVYEKLIDQHLAEAGLEVISHYDATKRVKYANASPPRYMNASGSEGVYLEARAWAEKTVTTLVGAVDWRRLAVETTAAMFAMHDRGFYVNPNIEFGHQPGCDGEAMRLAFIRDYTKSWDEMITDANADADT